MGAQAPPLASLGTLAAHPRAPAWTGLRAHGLGSRGPRDRRPGTCSVPSPPPGAPHPPATSLRVLTRFLRHKSGVPPLAAHPRGAVGPKASARPPGRGTFTGTANGAALVCGPRTRRGPHRPPQKTTSSYLCLFIVLKAVWKTQTSSFRVFLLSSTNSWAHTPVFEKLGSSVPVTARGQVLSASSDPGVRGSPSFCWREKACVVGWALKQDALLSLVTVLS